MSRRAAPKANAAARSAEAGPVNSAAQLLLEKAAQLDAAQPVPSPCISVCRMDAESGLCEGCFRTLDEIAAWGLASDAQRRSLWARLQERARQA